MKKIKLMAFDLGASSGRGILGQFDGSKLSLEEVHRFENHGVEITNHFYWDVLGLFREMQNALLQFANRKEGGLDSIGIDTWGVDYGLIDAAGELMGNPYHYRDARTDEMMEKAFEAMPKKEIFQYTGIAFQKFNTLYQLLADATGKPWLLEKAETLLFMPDLLAYFLTGEKRTEYTICSTGQLLDAAARDWCHPLLEAIGIPRHIFTPLQQPGTLRGKVLPAMGEYLGVGQVPVTAVATHDTASAVVAVPALEGDYAYLSSGTWSLMGVETDHPVINEKTLEWNYTNEGGVSGTYRLLKNIMGLWIIQECKREWDREGEVYGFDQLAQMANESPSFMSFIDPDDELFYSPGDMPRKIREFCIRTGQKVPETKGQLLRCVFESLAMKYRWSLEKLEDILGRPLKVLHIVGGGTKNQVLNQMTANAINRPVICGPVEATAIGNLMVQAMALAEVSNLREIRQVIKDSFPTQDYMPVEAEAWNDAYALFLKIMEV